MRRSGRGVSRRASIPVLAELVRDVERMCPKALVLNYVNPMAMIRMAIGQTTSLPFVGLCHGVQTTLDLISRYVGVKKEEIDYLAAGINHMAWFLKLEKDGMDALPGVPGNLELPETYINEKVRGEVARHFGYFMTETSGHLSDYLPWFRKNRTVLEPTATSPGSAASRASPSRSGEWWKRSTGTDYLKYETGKLARSSVEYCCYIVEALGTDGFSASTAM